MVTKNRKNGSARYSAVIEKSNKEGFVAQCIEVPGAIAQGDTKAETIESLKLTIDAVLKAQRKLDQARLRKEGKQVVYL